MFVIQKEMNRLYFKLAEDEILLLLFFHFQCVGTKLQAFWDFCGHNLDV